MSKQRGEKRPLLANGKQPKALVLVAGGEHGAGEVERFG
jgi:hypothetical protein